MINFIKDIVKAIIKEKFLKQQQGDTKSSTAMQIGGSGNIQISGNVILASPQHNSFDPIEIIESPTFDILQAPNNIYHAEGYDETLDFEKDYAAGHLSLSADFSQKIPPYAGYYVRPLLPKDWRYYIENKYIFSFDYISTDGFAEIIVEFKNINYQITDYKCKLVQNIWSTYNIDLGDQNVSEWELMKEICFVVKKNCLSAPYGKINIKNLCLKSTK